MAVETSPGQNPRPRVAVANTPGPAGSTSSQTRGLLPGERVLSELNSDGKGRFQLTHARLIYTGGGGADNGAVYASVRLKDISSVLISRRPRARRSAAWGIVGLFSAIGVWQVTPSSTIGIAAAIAVALISLVLMADYWIRPAGVHLEFHTAGGKVGGEVGGEVGGKGAHAVTFAREVEDARRRLVPGRINTPYRNYPSG